MTKGEIISWILFAAFFQGLAAVFIYFYFHGFEYGLDFAVAAEAGFWLYFLFLGVVPWVITKYK